MPNFLASKTLKYIWNHPNCKNQKVKRTAKFLGWQLYKRIVKKPIEIEIIPEIKIRCYPNGYSAASVLYCGLYDYHEMNFLRRYLRSEDSFLDIGANVGVYSLLAASKIETGTIYSFEALPKNYDRLQENIRLNKFKSIESYSTAISNTEGSILLDLAEGDSMPFINLNASSDKSIIVPTNTLDNVLKGRALENLTLAKIDIEGAELLAFKGAISLLEKQLPYVWILELNNTINHFGHTEDDVVSLLHNFGYELYSYNAEKNTLETITPKQKQGNNVLAVASNRLDFVKERLNLV